MTQSHKGSRCCWEDGVVLVCLYSHRKFPLSASPGRSRRGSSSAGLRACKTPSSVARAPPLQVPTDLPLCVSLTPRPLAVASYFQLHLLRFLVICLPVSPFIPTCVGVCDPAKKFWFCLLELVPGKVFTVVVLHCFLLALPKDCAVC